MNCLHHRATEEKRTAGKTARHALAHQFVFNCSGKLFSAREGWMRQSEPAKRRAGQTRAVLCALRASVVNFFKGGCIRGAGIIRAI